jgi:hypothetical protein
MQFDVIDRNGQELQYGDTVEFWCRNEQGNMDWVQAKIVEVRCVQGSRTVVKLLLNKKYQGKYSTYGHRVWATQLQNIRKI